MIVSHPARQLALLAAALTAALSAPAVATENGQVRALLGAPSYELATPQFPGLYGQIWYQHYSADDTRGDDGRALTQTVGGIELNVNAKVRADVLAPRLTWITEQIVADGRLGFSASLPLVHQRTTVSLSPVNPAVLGLPGVPAALAAASAARSGEETGLADMEVSGFVDWQGEESRFAAGLAVVAPTGDYEAGRAVNIGTGKYWTLRPMIVASRVFENGLQIGTRATYSFNTTNRDTDVRSGQYLHADWAALLPVADVWRLGVQGYVLAQSTDDRGPGVAEHGNQVRVYAAGPTVAYLSESGTWALDVKVMQEFEVRNRPEGTIGWVRLNLRLD